MRQPLAFNQTLTRKNTTRRSTQLSTPTRMMMMQFPYPVRCHRLQVNHPFYWPLKSTNCLCASLTRQFGVYRLRHFNSNHPPHIPRPPLEQRYIDETIASIRFRTRYRDPYEEWEKQTRKDALVG